MKYYQITDAAKKVNVESHVLRYWEDELQLPIERNKQGHRLYTDEDLSRFLYIKELKKEGLQLRAIRTKVHLRDEQRALGLEGMREDPDEGDIAERAPMPAREHLPERNPMPTREHLPEKKNAAAQRQQLDEDKSRKAAKLCMMLQQMVSTAVRRENEELMIEIKKGVAETVAKEMNYQFSLQEQRDEEHYKKLDEILREKERRNRMTHMAKRRVKKEKERAEKEKARKEKEALRMEKEKLRREKAERAKTAAVKQEKASV